MRTRTWRGIAAAAAAVTGAACSETTSAGDSTLARAALAASLASAPVGYGDLTTSYVGVPAASVTDGALWLAGGREARMERSALMGGGIGDAFIGGIGFGRGFGHHGPFGGGLGCAGTFDAATGRVACAPVTRNGLTITRSAAYEDAAGAVQQAFDSATTNEVNLRSAVSGTVAFSRAADGSAADDSLARRDGRDDRGGPGKGGRHGWGHGRGPGGRLLGDTATILSATTVVNSASERTVSGLAQGSTQRTVAAASRGEETTTGTSSRGDFTASRVVGDTTSGLVVPVQTDGRAYPTAGSVVRTMTATLTYAGEAPITITRREVVTYDGSATSTVVITENGTTRRCTRPLPRGPLSCE
jgi:hypothetical protein